MPSAVEEILRYCPPVIRFAGPRPATSSCAARIRAGDKVVVYYPAANRDPQVADPDVFDVGRSPNDHVSFGFGYVCLGAGFARLQLSHLLSEVLARMPEMEQAGPVERMRRTSSPGSSGSRSGSGRPSALTTRAGSAYSLTVQVERLQARTCRRRHPRISGASARNPPTS